MSTDPIVQAERMERLRKVQQLASRVYTNRDRIERNKRKIEEAASDNETAKIELESDVQNLREEAEKLGIAPLRMVSHFTDALVSLLVELPLQGAAPTPAASGYNAKGMPIAPSIFNMDIEFISGAALDKHAARIGVAKNMRLEFTRGSGESDHNYRERIRALLS